MELEGEGGAPRRKHKALEKERFRCSSCILFKNDYIPNLREENCYTNSGLEQRNVEESCLRLFEKVGISTYRQSFIFINQEILSLS